MPITIGESPGGGERRVTIRPGNSGKYQPLSGNVLRVSCTELRIFQDFSVVVGITLAFPCFLIFTSFARSSCNKR